MRIIQLVQKPQRRGAEVFAFQLTEELRRNHHEVCIAYLYPFSGPVRLPFHAQDVLLAGSERSVLEKVPGIHPLLLRRVKMLISEFRPDVVQANGARTLKYAAFAQKHKQQEWKLIYRNIGNPQDWVKGWFRRFFYQRIVMPEVNGIVGVSQTTLQSVMDFYRLAIPSIHIPRGVDSAAMVSVKRRDIVREENSTPADAPVVLYVGSLTREKRPDRFVRIVGALHLRFPQIHAWMIGDGPMKADLQQEASSFGLRDQIHFLGSQSDVASFLNASEPVTHLKRKNS